MRDDATIYIAVAVLLTIAALFGIVLGNGISGSLNVPAAEAVPTWYIKWIDSNTDQPDDCSRMSLVGSDFLVDTVTHVVDSSVSPVIPIASDSGLWYCWALAFRDEPGDRSPLAGIHLHEDGRAQRYLNDFFPPAEVTRKQDLPIGGVNYDVWLLSDPVDWGDGLFGARVFLWMPYEELP